MVDDATVYFVRRERAVAPSSPAVSPQQVVDLSCGLPTPGRAQDDLAPPARPLSHGEVFPTLARVLTGPALLTLEDLWHRLRKGELWDARR